MIDSGRNETDRKLEELEKEIHGIYAQANKELQEKMTEYFRKFKKRDEEKQKQLENGEITAEEYKRWRMGQMATGSRWKSMCDVIAKDMHNSNAIARSVTQGHMAEIYAINHNWTTYDIENKAMLNTNYAMYNSDVVENLLKENPDILPLLRDSDGNVVREKDIAWNKKVINAVMLQGILQGESIDKMAKRFEEVGVRNEKAAVRYARTATTGAENAGRIDGYRRAQKLGIHVIKVWLATLDGRTRDSHRALDGEEQEVEKEFSNGCMHPGDPNCPDPSEVWNCRCTLITKVDGQNYDVSKVKRNSKLGDMSYDEWKENRDVEPIFGRTKNKDKGSANSSKPDLAQKSTGKYVFKAAATLEEGIKFAESVLGIVYKDDNISIDAVNMLNKELVECYNTFGNLSQAGVLRYVYVNPKREKYYAGYSFKKKAIILVGNNVNGNNVYQRMKKKAEDEFKIGMWSAPDAEQSLRHEIGHAVEKMYRNVAGNEERMRKIEEIRQDLLKKHNIKSYNLVRDYLNGKMKAVGEDISYYATKSTGELIAESVSEYMSGNARETANRVIDIFTGRVI